LLLAEVAVVVLIQAEAEVALADYLLGMRV
jgi:hypothetical protein